MAKRVLAFDFGASSGRAILGSYADGKIELKEIHRFSNDPVEVNGTLYWDVLRLYYEIKQGITKSDLTVGAEAGSKVTQKVPAEKLYSAEGEVITFFATLMDIPESFFAKTVSAVAYVEYLDASGVKQYMYSDMLTKTVNDLK